MLPIVLFGVVGTVMLAVSHAGKPSSSIEAENGTISGCASSIRDTTASNSGAVKFGNCSSSNPDDPSNLDASGATIPDTDYAIPTGAIFMSTTGSDSNAGTQSAPVKTLNKAVSLVPSGGTIVVRGGTNASPAIYRDWYYSYNSNLRTDTFGVISKPVTIQAYPHEKAWFDGTDVEPTANWTSDGAGHWYMNWDTPSFCGTLPSATTSNYYGTSLTSQNIGATGNTTNGPCVWRDSSLDPSNPMAGDPQMVFIDGTYVHEVSSLSAATSGNFYYDWTNKRIYIATDPSGHTVELAARPMAMQLNGTDSKVLGLGFRRYATHVYTNNPGAIYVGAQGETFANDVFTKNAGTAMQLAKARDATINRSIFAFNGGTGIFGGSDGGAGGLDNTVIENSVFNNNNTELFWTSCSYSCAAAGIKLAYMDGFTIKDNIIENNLKEALGVWCDVACRGGVYVYNDVHNNGNAGIFYEISDTGIIASNLSYNNGGPGIRLGSANTKIFNNTLVNNGGEDVWVYDDYRSPDHPDTANTGATHVGPDTVGTQYANNVVASSGTINSYTGTRTDYTNTQPSQFFDLLDYNAYWRSSSSSQVFTHWADASATTDFTSVSSFTAAHSPLDSHSIDLTGGTDPFFVSAATGNYQLRSGNQAGTGTTIPSDVLTALGLRSGTNLPKGAITWPGE